MIDPSAFVHRLAHVEGATVGPRTKIWQFASIIRGTVLGADCNVASGAMLDGPKFGDRCIICQNVAMGLGFLVGDDVFIGPNVVVCNDRWPRAHKDGFSLDGFEEGMFTVIIGNGASIGAGAIVLPGVIIGARSMIAAGAVVECDVPEDTLHRRDGSLVGLDGRIPRRVIIRAGHAA